MKYQSTRGGSKESLSFEEAVLTGLAPDGGLYIPTEIPQLPLETVASWANHSFSELAFEIFRLFIDSHEIPDKDLNEIVQKSFATFSHPEVTPIQQLAALNSDNPNAQRLWVLELFHGPTFAFKDVALQFLGNLFDYFLARKNAGLSSNDPRLSQLTVLGATSGDTGGAAIYGLRGKENIQVFILHPHKRISPIQELQMTSVLDPNVHNIALEGTFDDCQDIVKAAFADSAIKAKYSLSAINSINWARILAQTTYYFHSFFNLLKAENMSFEDLPKVQFCVPSGNFGDILAGFYAYKMGLPIHKLAIATNENDILYRFLETGRYEKDPSSDPKDPVRQTLSPAMDILISSNFERLLWYLIRGDLHSAHQKVTSDVYSTVSATLRDHMNQLKTQGGFQVSQEILNRAKYLFAARRVDDASTTDAIGRYYHLPGTMGQADRQYVLDPHTAVGVVAAENIILDQNYPVYTICLSTASPGKFPEAVLNAINSGKYTPAGFKGIDYEAFAPQPLVDLAGLPQRIISVKTGGDKVVGYKGVLTVLQGTLSRN